MKTEYVIDEFMQSLEARGRAERTLRAYHQRVEVFQALPGEIEQIGPGHIDRLMVHLRAKHLAAATLASYVQTLRTFFRWCRVRGYIERSPADELQKPRLELSRLRKAVPQADLLCAIEAARRGGDRLGLAVLLFLADTGCRAGELIGLNLADIDLVCRSATCCGKTGERVLDFTDVTERALVEWIKARPETDPAALFTNSSGRLKIWGLYKLMWKVCNLAGVPRFGPQAVRHRVGQGWIDAGANLELVRLKLGHKDISTTSRFYAHQDRERQKSATRKYSLVS